MVTRIVKLEINHSQIESFLELFSIHAIKMESVQGCISLKLVQDIHSSNLFFTISEWHREEDLQIYRSSELFTLVWSKVKPLFCAQAIAWTTQSLYHGKN